MTAADAASSANWADVVMLVLTAASVVVAAAAVGHARRATAAAAKAGLEAAEANRIAKEANGIASDSNAIAERAAQDARDAPLDVAWDALVVALADVQTFDASGTEDPGRRLTALRTRIQLLLDRLPWEDVGHWLAAEQAAGLALMREAYDRGKAERRSLGRELTPQESLDLDEEFHRWVAACTNNVRLLRRVGPADFPSERLTEHARAWLKNTCDRNGWPVPSGRLEGLEPLPPVKT